MNVLQFSESINFYPILCAPMPRRLASPPICKLKVFWLVLRLHVHADRQQIAFLARTKSDKSML